MSRVSALRVNQPIGEFYVTVLKAKDIVSRVRNRPRTSDADSSEDIQRIFSSKRVKDIAAYTEDVNATFPTPIILAVTSEVVTEIIENAPAVEGAEDVGHGDALQDSRLVVFNIPDEGLIGDVLDGQHRVLGLNGSKKSDDFDLIVVLMFDLDADDKAYVFSIINSKQTPVSSSLIYDLFDLSEYRSPQKTCHLIAQALNREPDSPFYQRIKMLGRKEDHHKSRVMLSQGSFAARLQDLITRDAARDARLEKEGAALPGEADCPFRKYYLRSEDPTILKVMQNYFEAARQVFPDEWEDDSGNFVVRKTVGYTALMYVLRRILPEAQETKDLSVDYFKTRFAVFKSNLNQLPLTSANFPSSGQGAGKLRDALLGELNT